MAQLKDLIVNGASHLIGDTTINTIEITRLRAPTTDGGNSYSYGSSDQVLKTNGSSIYWGTVTSGVSGVKGNAESDYRTGQVNLTAANIGAAASSHTHGNIQNSGALQTTDVEIATGDKLVITDSSDSSKVTRASISFNTANTGKCLTQAGTWADFTHPTTTAVAAAAVKVGKDSNGHVVIGSALTASDVGLDNVENVALSSWTGSTNITTLGTISTGTVPLANISGAADLQAIEALSGTSGLLKKTAANTWTLDTTAYTTNTGTVTSVSAGVGLTGGPVTTSGTIKANLNNESSLGILGSTDRLYAVGVDINGKLCVNVPWVGSIIQDNLTSSTNTTDALSAKQGYLLANGSARDSTKLPLAGGEMSGNITVNSTSSIDLGSSSKSWNNVYANTFNGSMAHYIDIGGKHYNGSSDVIIYASDLGVSSALNFAGVIYETLPPREIEDTNNPGTMIPNPNYPNTIPQVHLYTPTGNHIGDAIGDGVDPSSISNGTVVICHATQDEFLWSEDAQGNAGWYSLGLASSFALHNHSHGDILNDGAMANPISINNVDVSSASKALVTDSNSKITIEDLTVSDPLILNNAVSTSFISSISQSSTGKITAVKSNISDVYVYNTGDTMTDSLTISKAGECGVIVNNTSKSHQTEFIVGNSGNGGVYDRTNSKWVVYSDVSGNVTLNGNANTATKATQDGDGNTITSTYVKKAGDTMTGQLYINKSDDVGGATAPGTTAPFVLGAKDGQHIEIDSNEILAKNNGTTPGTLYLQDSTGGVQICGSEGLQLTAGLLKVTKNSNTVTIGSQNSNFCHIYNSASIPFIFNNSVLTSNGGNLGSSSYPFTNIYMAATGQISRAGNSGSYWQGRDKAIVRQTSYTGYNAIISSKTTNGSWEIGPYSNNYLYFVYVPDTAYSGSTNTGTVNTIKMDPTGKVYAAVWNDYAEYRKDNEQEKNIQAPGKCVKELGDGSLALTTKRLERGCEIISDTFGFAIGQDEENSYNTPIASSGRVLAYPYESIEDFASHIGWAVCSGPDGTVSIMTEEEEEKYPSRIIGTISEIPNYEEWGTGKVKVNGRVWIRIK